MEESGDQLTEEEIVSTCNLLLIAGHETTVNLIANAILAMLRHPEQWAALGADAGRASAVVEETLRYDPPVQLAGRNALEDMVIGDTTMIKGDTMLVLLAAAQRDPAEYDRPDTFDPDRGTLRHLGFGRGAHYCLGAPLARLEAGVALSAVTARFPGRPAGQRAAVQDERHAARHVRAVRHCLGGDRAAASRGRRSRAKRVVTIGPGG